MTDWSPKRGKERANHWLCQYCPIRSFLAAHREMLAATKMPLSACIRFQLCSYLFSPSFSRFFPFQTRNMSSIGQQMDNQFAYCPSFVVIDVREESPLQCLLLRFVFAVNLSTVPFDNSRRLLFWFFSELAWWLCSCDNNNCFYLKQFRNLFCCAPKAKEESRISILFTNEMRLFSVSLPLSGSLVAEPAVVIAP